MAKKYSKSLLANYVHFLKKLNKKKLSLSNVKRYSRINDMFR